MWLPLEHPLQRTWPTTQARALDWELNRRPFWFTGQHSIHWATPARAKSHKSSIREVSLWKCILSPLIHIHQKATINLVTLQDLTGAHSESPYYEHILLAGICYWQHLLALPVREPCNLNHVTSHIRHQIKETLTLVSSSSSTEASWTWASIPKRCLNSWFSTTRPWVFSRKSWFSSKSFWFWKKVHKRLLKHLILSLNTPDKVSLQLISFYIGKTILIQFILGIRRHGHNH